MVKKARQEKRVMGSEGRSEVGKPSSSTSGGAIGRGGGGSVGGWGERWRLIGGGAASSSEESSFEGGAGGVGSRPLAERARQNWKKLGLISVG